MAKGTVNKVIILGRLGQDPDIRSTASGTQVANLSIATNELGPKEQNMNERATITEWHKVILFGRTAELAAQYLKKGSQVYIEGRLQTRKWQDQSGADRYSTEVVGNEMQFIGGNDGGNRPPAPQQQYQNQAPQGFTGQPAQSQQFAPPQQNGPGGIDDFDEDLPW